MNCLVMGGCGFLGSHLVEALLDQGHEVKIFDRPDADPKNIASLLSRVPWCKGNFTDQKNLEEIIGDTEILFHLIGTTLPQSSTHNPIFDIQSNVVSTIRLLEAAKSTKLKKIVFTSSGGTIYGVPEKIPIPEDHPTSPICSYGITKLTIEKFLHLYARLYNINYVSLRISNAYGPRQDPNGSQGAVAVFLGKALQGKPITIWGDGSSVRDYIYFRDIIQACIRVIPSSHGEEHVFNIGSGKGTSLSQLLDLIKRISGRKIKVHHIPARKFDVPVNTLDISRAAEVIGWQPQVSLEEGLRETWEYLFAKA